ncbi:pilus assembly protein [Kineococcus aurantiacus]|uniref:Flp pilus assembly protein TadG n=1 Tax=Kineococcus aurantiacus TaxID=37633 RepID=A0A7Y9J206_9ACTN|nr:pilus assembly protein [Kineococcus aurantiacus]NYD23558.1 Flp pilus assembly protein TadG [Kineococcus aurantiacus]
MSGPTARNPALGDPAAGDEGSAAVEFLAVGVLLLVPIAYLVLTLGRVQAAAFAAGAGAAEASRLVATGAAVDRAGAAVVLAVTDQHLDPRAATLDVACSADPCATPEGEVAATVRLDVELPLVPAFLAGAVPLRVPVDVRRVAVADRFAPVGPG